MKAAPTLGILVLLTTLAGAAPRVAPSPQTDANRRLVTLRVHDDEDRTVVVSIAIGNAATISRPGMPMLRITPAISPDGLLSLTGSLVSTGNDATPVVTGDTITGPVGLGSTARIALGEYVFYVTWVDDKTIAGAATSPEDGASQCCVVCEGIETCACRVQAPCGGCCDQACGGCGQGGSQTPCSTAVILESPGARDSSGRGSVWRTAGTAKSRENRR